MRDAVPKDMIEDVVDSCIMSWFQAGREYEFTAYLSILALKSPCCFWNAMPVRIFLSKLHNE